MGHRAARGSLCLLASGVHLAASAGLAVSIDWQPVGSPGNACESQLDGCFGSVDYHYRIATFEVTNDQYAEFLNAVAASDPNGLYSTQMSAGSGGITRSGSTGSYSYGAIAGREEKPVSFVSFFDALRFANWLHNGQPMGGQDSSTTEDGAYTFNGATSVGGRNPGAQIFLPTEDEWYKAAYYDALSTSYFDYPGLSDSPMICTAPTAAANSANCDAPGNDASDVDVDDLVDVGSYPGSPGPFGTYDLGGNVFEWNEAGAEGGNRVIRGGSWDSGVAFLAAASRLDVDPTGDYSITGFRLVLVPEPGTALLVGLGLAGMAGRTGRRRG